MGIVGRGRAGRRAGECEKQADLTIGMRGPKMQPMEADIPDHHDRQVARRLSRDLEASKGVQYLV